MVVVALAMLGEYDIKFQNRIASDLPAFLVNPSHRPRGNRRGARSARRSQGRRGARRRRPGGQPRSGAGAERPRAAAPRSGPASGLPTYGPAPEFVDNQRWFNTPGGRPLTMRGLRGRVVLVDFWTYSCINCLRTLPYLKAWDSATARTV